MNSLQDYCNEQIQMLDDIALRTENFLEEAPEGNLRVSKSGNSYQYYWKNHDDSKNGIYLKRSEENAAQELAQKEYDINMLKLVKKRRAKLYKLSIDGDEEAMVNMYENLSVARQRLVVPFFMSDEKYAEDWMKEHLKKAEYNNSAISRWQQQYPIDEDSGFATEKGEIVRSKTEKIIADKLYKMGIPYLYEESLELQGYGYVHPDFTLLNKRRRKTYYWEHMGMMDVPEYAEKSIKKIAMYEKNQMYQGEKLLLTFESKNHSLNIKVLDNMIKNFLL